MTLSDEKVIEFQKIHKEHFGKEISKEDARENGIKLLELISTPVSYTHLTLPTKRIV